jgi:histidine triad (HIT) family protein
MATIFTKIINGEIPCHKVAETDTHIAFLDINPIAEGHTLVVPKQETDYFFDLSDDLLSSTMTFAKQIARAIDDALDPIRTGVIVEGLEVPHAHVHLVPIYKKTQVVALGNSIEIAEARMPEIARQIATAYQEGR